MNTQTRIANRYQIQRELGEGGMGSVFLAHDIRTDTLVAVKHLKPEVSKPERIKRFSREGAALRQLNHPNIVKLLDTVEENGQHYLIMEYVSGGDLAQYLKKQKLSIEQLLRYALDLADALTRAHKLNIIHRDLKPSNILIADDGTLRLTDFGVAFWGNDEQQVTPTDTIVGTMHYLAPEVIKGIPADTRSDIWAFGLILFELICGKYPFTHSNIAQTLYAIVNDTLPDLELMRLDAPIELIDLVYRMLERDPQLRISSVRYVGAVLEDILHGRTTTKQSVDRRFQTLTQEMPIIPKTNLPAQSTPFVGRGSEVISLIQLLNNSANRLITVLAPGGMGKTRLSLEVAEQELETYPDGVYFVELAPVSNPDDIVSAIAEALQYQFQGGDTPPKQQILDMLHSRALLLILDNFEHLLDGKSIVDEILKAAPYLTILVTSRQQLSITGETIFPLSGMDFHSWETLEDAATSGSAQLFLQSARRVQPQFDITKSNLGDIARICELVQGMPLGIILSASWLRMLTPAEITQEIVGSIDFLGTDAVGLPERQQSIRAVFDYSWESMNTTEQDVFMKLSVFRGGFTREAAQAIADATLRTLMSLTNKSLIHRDTKSGRYTIHELLRQYAEEKLDTADLTNDIQQAHAQFFTSLSEEAEYEMRYANQEYWYRLLEDEHDNIRIALDWTLQTDIHLSARMTIALRDFWFYQGYHNEGYTWCKKLLQQSDAFDTLTIGRLYAVMGSFAWILQNTPEATYYFDLAVETVRKTGNKRFIAWALLYAMGATTTDPNRRQETLDFFHEALDLFQEVDDPAGIATVHNMVGALYQRMEDYDRAANAFQTCIDLSRENGDLRRVAINTMNLARVRVLQGEPTEGLVTLKESGTLMRKLGFKYMQLYSYLSYIELLIELERYEQALVVASAYFSLSESLGMKIQPWSVDSLNRALEMIQDHLDPATYRAAELFGKSMSLDEMNDYTLNIELDD